MLSAYCLFLAWAAYKTNDVSILVGTHNIIQKLTAPGLHSCGGGIAESPDSHNLQ